MWHNGHTTSLCHTRALLLIGKSKVAQYPRHSVKNIAQVNWGASQPQQPLNKGVFRICRIRGCPPTPQYCRRSATHPGRMPWNPSHVARLLDGSMVTTDGFERRRKNVWGTPVLSTRWSLLISQYSFVSMGQSRYMRTSTCAVYHGYTDAGMVPNAK